MPQLTVKARLHHGTKSLDLTIPVEIIKEGDIKEGDIFLVDLSKNKDGRIVLTYEEIFKQKWSKMPRFFKAGHSDLIE